MFKKKNLRNLLSIMMVAVVSYFIVSCGDDDEKIGYYSGIQTPNNGNSSSMDATYENQLTGTSWKQSSCAIYYSNGDVETKISNAIVTYSSNHVWYIIGISGYNGWGTWKVENGVIEWDATGNNGGMNNPSFRGILVASNFGPRKIVSLTDNKMRLVWPNNDKDWVEYTRVSYQEPSDAGSGSGTSGGSGSSTESLYFTNFNYTATQTSVTVKFYTNERASSATIKYGEYSASSSASATITNKEVSATIRNLKKGTKYYVRCTARNSNGSVTSDDYPVMTNY